MLQEVSAIFIASTKCFCCTHQTSASPHSFFTLWELLCAALLPSCLPQGCKVSPKANGRTLSYHLNRELWGIISYKHLTYSNIPLPLLKLGLKFDECCVPGSAYLPKVVLLCCSPACLSAAWLEWKWLKSLGSVISLGCSGVSAKPWRFARASKLEDAWVLGILKGAVAFKNQEQKNIKVRTLKYSCFQAVCDWELKI